jgi:hypothetical protein
MQIQFSARRSWALILGWAMMVTPCLQLAVAAPITIESARFEDTVRLGDAQLKLNGAGLRGVLWIKAFAAGLYVHQPSSNLQNLLDEPGAKRISLKMLMNIPVDEIVKALRNGLKKNTTPQEFSQMSARMDQIEAKLRAVGDQHEGDTLDLDWRAGGGLVLGFNGKPHAGPAIEGYDIYRGLLKIFIGERAIDKRLRAGLLGAWPAAPVAVTPPSAPSSAIKAQP